MTAECYIGFSKLLKEEMKAFEMKDSVIFEMRVDSLNKRKNPSGQYDNVANIATQKKTHEKISMHKKKVFTEKLWFCGKKVGEINGQISFYNLPILYQMRVGVMTKNGIFFTSRPIL